MAARGDTEVRLAKTSLDVLMPLHLRLDAKGRIAAVGPTLRKLTRDHKLCGGAFFRAFELRRPANARDMESLLAHAGRRLHLNLRRSSPLLSFRGVALPLSGGGMLVNLSFGIGVMDAVRDHALTDADFAPTDLAVEMLYLVEAKTAVMEELRNLNRQLAGAKAEAETRALTDTLTGLANRRAADLRLSELESVGRPFGLMNLDLDFFKAVNDSYGHDAGDQVLVAVAQVLRAETRAGDLVARPGGDEFQLIFPDRTDGAELKRVAYRLIDRICEPIPYQGKQCHVSASIGIAISDNYTRPWLAKMQQDVDIALYASKRAGRGTARLFGDPHPEQAGFRTRPQTA